MVDYQDLSRPSQLSFIKDFNAKQVLLNLQPTNLPSQQAFPLKSVCAFAGSGRYLPTWVMKCDIYHTAHLLIRFFTRWTFFMPMSLIWWTGKWYTAHSMMFQNCSSNEHISKLWDLQNHGMGQNNTEEMSKLHEGA
jgi:hypothetical protein